MDKNFYSYKNVIKIHLNEKGGVFGIFELQNRVIQIDVIL